MQATFRKLSSKKHSRARIKIQGVHRGKLFHEGVMETASHYSSQYTVEPDFSKLFERRKNVYYCQVFTIYHVIYAMISNFGKQQKVY